MPSNYAGNPATFPADYVIPDDSQPPTAALTNVGLEALGDRTAWLKANLPFLEMTDFTASGTIVAPAGATHAILEGCGGGGGGGGGAGSGGVGDAGAGGGGGGGALWGCAVVAVVAGTTYNVTIGSGGAGGIGGGPGSGGGVGSPGETTRFHKTGDPDLAGFGGGGAAGGGRAGTSFVNFNGVANTPFHWGGPGGASTTGPIRSGAGSLTPATHQVGGPAYGGNGASNTSTSFASDGYANPTSIPTGATAITAGLAGAHGSSAGGSGSYIGGGGGGGGGAGPRGNGQIGGSGGAGSASVSSGAPADGTAGSAGVANTGSGGGGGGAAGGGPSGSSGGNGGAGGSGFLRVIFLRREA